MPPRLARIILLLSVAGASMASTCATLPIGPVTKDVKVDHDDRLTPSARASYEILPGIDTRRRGSLLDLAMGKAPIQGARADGAKIKKATFTLAVAGEFATTDGHDNIDLASNENLQVGIEIPGPALVNQRVDNVRGHISLRPGGRFFDILSIEAIVGVGIDDTDLHLESPGFDFREGSTEPGAVFGARLSLRPIPLFDLYGQATIIVGNFASGDVEAGIQLNLTPNLGVYGGFRRWTYNKDSYRGSGSDADFDFEGPTVGGSLTF